MQRKSTYSRMPYTDLTRVSSTFNRSLRIIHSSTAKKPSKIVVGDQSGTITCFKWLKEEIHTTFQQTKDQPITALTLNDDKIVIAYGQTIETIKKKGKILSTFTLSLNEDITSLQAKGDSIWCCGEYVYNCYKNEKDSHFFMSKDIINDIILIDLGFDELCPVLACKDKAIRVLHGSELLFEIETSSNTKSLHEMPNKQIIYGLENGSIGGVLLNKESIKHGCLLNDVNEGSVNCISSYDFRKDGGRQVVIGRDNGNIDIFEWNTDKPYILASQALNESITGIDNGYVTGITDQDIVIVTYSGKIKAFHCDPARDFSAWQEAEMNILSPLKCLKQNITKTNIQQEIESYRQEITLEKNKYQEKSKELIAVNRQFHLKNSLKLLEGEGAYLLRLEIGIGIDFVAIQSCVEIVSLDIDQYFGLQTQHKNMELFDDNLWNSNKNNCFVFHSSSDNITRFTWKFRVCEGEQGVLTAFIASKRVPKTCQTCEFLIKALSLHSSIYDIAAHNVEIEKRPMNRLEMSGDWTLRTFNAWLSQCIPDVPSHTLNTNEISLSWQSIFAGDYITVTYTNASAIFEADSVTAIAILQEFLTKLAIKNNVSISNVNININTQSIIHFFHLIQPKLQFHHKIHRQHSLINALKEIEAHEQDLMCLSDEMQNILKNSDQILKDFKTSPKHLQFIKNMIWSNTQNWAKLQNATITMKNLEKLKRGLDNTDCDIILSAIRDIMR